MNYLLFSVDVFDTSLLRKVGNPNSLFFLLGSRIRDKGILDFEPQIFNRLRVEAENQAFLKNKFFNLGDIYRHLHNITQIDSDLLKEVMEEELSLEMNSTVANPNIVDEISRIRKTGAQIAHVSDMYLPKSFIKKILLREGIMEDDDLLYVSNEDKASKGDGSIFRKISKEYNIHLNQISHIGNCYHADYTGAKSVGVKATHYSMGNLTSRESKLEQMNKFTEGNSSYWAGVSRIGRLGSMCAKALSREYFTLEQIACSVAAPILCSYAKWVLDQAVEDKVSNLFFVARDGQLLWEISKRLKENNSNYKRLNLKYLHGSREAWRPCTIIEIDDFALNWLMDDHPTLTPKKISQRLKIDIYELRKAPQCPRQFYQENEVIPLEHHNEIRKWLTTHAVSKLIEHSVIDQRELLLRYFEQEGVFDDSSAFVEIGYSGQTQHSIHRMLKSCGKTSPSNYFFGLAKKNLLSEDFQAKAYFFNQTLNQGFPASPDLNYFVLLESFCMADHGRTLAYAIKNENVVPILAQKAKYFASEGWEDFFKKKVLSTAVAYSKYELQKTDTVADKLGILEIIRNFWQNPSFKEAKVWGSHLKEHDPTSGQTETLSRPYSIIDLYKNLVGVALNVTWWEIARKKISNKFILSLIPISNKIGKHSVTVRIFLGRCKNILLCRELPKMK